MDLLERTLAAASKDQRTTDDKGTLLAGLPQGGTLRASPPITDDRGSLFEVFNEVWPGQGGNPVRQAYVTTMRPGVVKGWGLHKRHGDRYFLLTGTIQFLMYDVRPDSPTLGHLFKVTVSEANRQFLTIPPFVWHADHNVGDTEALLLSMPTEPYDYADPDKWRLPLDTPLIPHKFPGARGY
ncbi:dTDP-4-dehydrorhamnose 3,5-epimerase family protein [Neogemmobacter tilapiae]|uniref:dTDP-4-dehydrorhamnose 3,5-epimerase n=1 Tax=Neogemmobacter tilapiae TaxID=875041 RepID=A0A918TIE0_9RHOB|nr:dTDP-4-dehydrorhamnose 3,5-epimerase family protein [Gemmobacter tilapiae]GHC49180.1 hypothetical protein GCM10007315_09130 [Gemmobacter tilapiae]